MFFFLLSILGWQPGVQQGAADWDEDWDKFEDEGMQKLFHKHQNVLIV